MSRNVLIRFVAAIVAAAPAVLADQDKFVALMASLAALLIAKVLYGEKWIAATPVAVCLAAIVHLGPLWVIMFVRESRSVVCLIVKMMATIWAVPIILGIAVATVAEEFAVLESVRPGKLVMIVVALVSRKRLFVY